MLNVSYDTEARRAICTWAEESQGSEWTQMLRRALVDHSPDIEQVSALKISVPWYSFISARPQLSQVLSHFRISLSADSNATVLLRQANANEISYQNARNLPPVTGSNLRSKLASVGFIRQLTEQQERNVCRLVALPAGATFSVPGAGKTTEAFAYFFFRAEPNDRLLIIAPKNALGAWDEQLTECIGTIREFVRLEGGIENVSSLLQGSPQFSIVTYQQLNTTRDVIAAYVAASRTFVFLDESHRIKGGNQKRTCEAVLGISHLPVGKLILSGTPMPQADSDLVPQLTFLYPQINSTPENVVALMQPIYVRTTKAELGLPPITFLQVPVQMRPSQSKVYNLLKLEVARQAENTLGNRGKAEFRRLGRSIMRLLAFVSNPLLLAHEIGGIGSEYLDAILAESANGPKVDYACQRARILAREGKKVLIWSSFVNNVEVISERLSDLGAVFIHGSVDSGEDNDSKTREGKIKLFHDSPEVMVMVANPAAASEGISLHRVCHHAIYVDRTYNAAHFLQSQDRIHRLGLPTDQFTVIEILESPGTIDESVKNRLHKKIDRMATALNDHSICIDLILVDPSVPDDEDTDYPGADIDDIRDLIANLRGIK